MKKSAPKVQVLSPDDFSRVIKGSPAGGYLFFGEEDYLKNVYLGRYRKSVLISEDFEVFNYFRVSFSPASQLSVDETLDRLDEAVAGVPMMQDMKFVEVSDADFAAFSQSQLSRFRDSVRSGASYGDTAIAVICRSNELVSDYKLESSAVYKALTEALTPVRFDLLTRGKLSAWIKKRASSEGVFLSDEAAEALCDICSGRMYPAENELCKLIAYAKGKGGSEAELISDADVKRLCAQSAKDEIPFAMDDAAQRWNLIGILEVLKTARDMREEPIAVLSKLSKIYCDMFRIKCFLNDGNTPADIASKLRMNQFRVSKYASSVANVPYAVLKNAVELAYETDLTLKSTQTDAWVLLEALAARIYTPKSLRS